MKRLIIFALLFMAIGSIDWGTIEVDSFDYTTTTTME